MKKGITKQMTIVVLLFTVAVLVLNLIIQSNIARSNQIKSAKMLISEIRDLVKWSVHISDVLEDAQRDTLDTLTQAAARLVEDDPGFLLPERLPELVELLNLSELHVLDNTGTIISGTVPDYYGYQISEDSPLHAFLMLMEDKSLIVCDTIALDAAQQNRMTYGGIWLNDETILLLGWDSQRLVAMQTQDELDRIFSVIPKTGATLYAIDQQSGQILGTTDESLTGLTQEEAGLALNSEQLGTGYSATVNGIPSFCYFEPYNDMLVGVTISNETLYNGISYSVIVTSVCVLLAALLMLAAVLWYIDCYVIRGINDIIQKLSQISRGNLDTLVDVNSSPEFTALSTHINRMVRSLLNTTNKLSKIFDLASMPVGVYEYHADMKRVMSTRKVQTMLMLSESEYLRLTSDKDLFEAYMTKLRSNPCPQYSNAYRIPAETEYYLQILPYTEDGTTVCILSDVTESVLEKQQLEHDRDYDVLTGLLNRRAYYTQMSQLFAHKEAFQAAAMIAFDMDGLKQINDTYGHVAGDKAIQAAASIFKRCPTEKKVAARLGGDEFSVFLYGDSKEELEALIRQMHQIMENTRITTCQGHSHPIRLSGGYLFYPDYDLEYSQMLRLADLALYYSKKRQLGEFHCYTPDTSPLEHH